MKALVTGGGGFLGGAIARRLAERGDAVRTFSRSAYPQLDALKIEQARGDLAELSAVRRAVAGRDVVFHTAAKVGIWGKAADFERANILGTQNLIEACRLEKVRKLVFTSSPSVTFAGRDQEGVDESAPYPSRFLAHYPRTKAEAERRVLAASGAELATVSLRPHLIWGPGDTHLVPSILARAKAGSLRLVGRRGARVDTIYIDNAVDAHLLAAERLAPGAPPASKAYFVSNGEPIPMADFINGIVKAGGLPPVTRYLPASVAYMAGAIFELIYILLGHEDEPRMTRFLARQLDTAHWFNIGAARRDLGYEPKVALSEGFLRLTEHLQKGGR
ncbi:MAG: NAD-dependent epimerase/dehydratase family protein [Planctomycetes bacterium]|nr:NAD-dependent epimerase/dehydratase family protein [Planctomycetota bacterium]